MTPRVCALNTTAMKRIILYDDYNHLVYAGDVIGAVRQTFSATAFRNGWKIIETNDTKDMAKIYRIRKLTAREAFRLMGVRDDDIDKIQSAGISESQQYKLAGNSIVVDTLLHGIYIPLFAKQDGAEDTLF